MSDTTHDIARLIDQMTQAIDAVRPGGVFSSNSKLSAALFALYEAMPALTALLAERDAWKARAEAAEAAIKYVLDGYGLNEPHFKRQPEDDEDDWIVAVLRPVVAPPAEAAEELADE